MFFNKVIQIDVEEVISLYKKNRITNIIIFQVQPVRIGASKVVQVGLMFDVHPRLDLIFCWEPNAFSILIEKAQIVGITVLSKNEVSYTLLC